MKIKGSVKLHNSAMPEKLYIYAYICIHTISKVLSITIAGINFLGTNACLKNTQYAGQRLSVKATAFNLQKYV